MMSSKKKVLVNYSGGTGDLFSVLPYIEYLNRNPDKYDVTSIVTGEDKLYLVSKLYKNINFISNICASCEEKKEQNTKRNSVHNRVKKNIEKYSQSLYDKSIIKNAFTYLVSRKDYADWCRSLIKESDLIISQYLSVNVNLLLATEFSNKRWYMIRPWYKFPNEKYYNYLNIFSPYLNLYYYPKGLTTDDEIGLYHYTDIDYYEKISNPIRIATAKTILKRTFKLNVFLNLGSMSSLHTSSNDLKETIKKYANDDHYFIVSTYESSFLIRDYLGVRDKFLILDENFPHEKIMEYIDLVIHHGGCGTTNRCLKHNKKQIIFPFQLDQFYWKEVVDNLKGKDVSNKYNAPLDFESILND